MSRQVDAVDSKIDVAGVEYDVVIGQRFASPKHLRRSLTIDKVVVAVIVTHPAPLLPLENILPTRRKFNSTPNDLCATTIYLYGTR